MTRSQRPLLVWYAAFGSNLDSDRFSCYLNGGRPTGGSTHQPGCRDPRPPRKSRPALLPYRLYFAGRSVTWADGGVAYLDHQLASTAGTIARLYLITVDQFADVVAQECGGHRLAGPIDMDRLRSVGSMTAVAGLYGHLLHPGDLDEIPIVTCTSPEQLATRIQRPPSIHYRRCIARGLQQIRPDLDRVSIDEYLGARIVDPPRPHQSQSALLDGWPTEPHRIDGWDDPETWNGDSFDIDDLGTLGWDWASTGDVPGEAARINHYLESIT